MEPKNLTKTKTKLSMEENKRSLEMERERDRELITVKFINHEERGGYVRFVARCYKGDPIERYELIDGQIYKLPLGIVKYINTYCATPIYSYLKSEEGKVHAGFSYSGHQMQVVGKQRRLECIPLDASRSDVGLSDLAQVHMF